MDYPDRAQLIRRRKSPERLHNRASTLPMLWDSQGQSARGPWWAPCLLIACPGGAGTILCLANAGPISLGGSLLRQAFAPGCRSLTLMVIAALLASLAFVWARFVEPRMLTTTRLTIAVKGLDPGLAGTKIILLTDLHGAEFGPGQRTLATAVRRENPDAIVFAGDLIDSNHDGLAAGLAMLAAMADIAPTYLVWGNHDYIAGVPELRAAIAAEAIAVTDLDDAWSTLELPGGTLIFAGLARSWRSGVTGLPALASAARAVHGDNPPLIAVIHSPGPVPVGDAVSAGADLVLAGHTHGGQIRLPLLGAVWSPVDGFFSRTAYGLRQLDSGYLFTSRGLGTSVWPVRFMCPPEVVVLTLQPAP